MPQPPSLKTIRLPVRALVEAFFRSGDLVLTAAGSPARAIRAHRLYQAGRPEGYRAEVPVGSTVTVKGFCLEVSGRIDGVTETPEGPVVEEIKTWVRPPAAGEAERRPAHWAQAKVYAHLLLSQGDQDRALLRLVYLSLSGGQPLVLEQSCSKAELDGFFDLLTAGFVDRLLLKKARLEARDRSIAELKFPFPSFRAGQRAMAVAVYRAVQDGRRLLIQAPTGVGKTAAVLFPAVKALAQGEATRLFYLTARTTGRLAAEQALDRMRAAGLTLTSVTLTAREKICPQDRPACDPELCPRARGHFDRLGAALEEAASRTAWTRERIEALALDHRVCPFELSLDLACEADCVIGDYNYAFDPRAFLRRFFDPDLFRPGEERYVFLVDEAHQLIDRAREMFSAGLSKQSFLDLRRAVKTDLPRLFKAAGRINSFFLDLRRRCQERDGAIQEKEDPKPLYPLLEEFCRLAEEWLAGGEPAPFREELQELFFSVSGFLKVAEEYGPGYATLMEAKGREVDLRLFCLDPSARLGKALDRAAAAVFFSATLAPLDYHARLLGCPEGAPSLTLGSPFPRRNLKLLLAENVSTLFGQRERTKTSLARTLAGLVRARPGNYLLYFPSYQYLELIRPELAQDLEGAEIISQSPGMGEPEREDFLARFGTGNQGTLVGLAVMGGIFGEGIDLRGDRLTGVAVVGVGLPPPSPERELIRSHFDGLVGAGFEYAYLFPGFNRVLQAAGRVIRSETDRGVVLLVDQRLGRPAYRRLFPGHWRPVRVPGPAGLEAALARFWGEEGV